MSLDAWCWNRNSVHPSVCLFQWWFTWRWFSTLKYEGRSINKLQNGDIALILKIRKIRNICFVRDGARYEKLVLFTHKKSHTGFQSISNLVTLSSALPIISRYITQKTAASVANCVKFTEAGRMQSATKMLNSETVVVAMQSIAIASVVHNAYDTKVCINVDAQITNRFYCKTLNVGVPFISRISWAKQNREIKGHEYQLRAKIRQNYYSISNCGFNSPKWKGPK